MSEKLYYDLLNLRKKLKGLDNSGRAPTICTDSALKEMAKLEPKTKAEMLSIAGLGKTFVDKYGDEFLAAIKNYHDSFLYKTKLTFNVKETLQELENRLVNINKKNRLLKEVYPLPISSSAILQPIFLHSNTLLYAIVVLLIKESSVSSITSLSGEKSYFPTIDLKRSIKSFLDTVILVKLQESHRCSFPVRFHFSSCLQTSSRM